jgi:hypothetical protein
MADDLPLNFTARDEPVGQNLHQNRLTKNEATTVNATNIKALIQIKSAMPVKSVPE